MITAGTIGGIIGLIVLLIIVGLITIWAWNYSPTHLFPVNLAGCVLLALACVGFWWWGMAFTLSPDYHAWNMKTGVVTAISSRIIAEDTGASQRFVVVLNGQQYGIDDTRASLLKVGDPVTLRCKKEYQWGVPRSAQGWGCNWG